MGLRFDYLLRKNLLNLDRFNHPVFTKTDGPDVKILEDYGLNPVLYYCFELVMHKKSGSSSSSCRFLPKNIAKSLP
jgi:hypothetical protein